MKRRTLILAICFITAGFSLAAFVLAKGDHPQGGYTLNIAIPEFNTEVVRGDDAEEYIKYSPDSSLTDVYLTDEPGKPQVPVMVLRAAVPLDAGNIKVTIEGQSLIQTLNHHIYPAPKLIPQQDKEGLFYMQEVFFIDEEAYATDTFYPLNNPDSQKERLREIRYLSISIYPHQYNPKTRRLKTYEASIDVVIRWDSANETIELPYSEAKFRNILKNINVNKIEELYPIESPVKADMPLFDDGNIYFPANPDPADLALPHPVDYLIITADEFYGSNADPLPLRPVNIRSPLWPLVNHRSSRYYSGYDVAVVSTSTITQAIEQGYIPLYEDVVPGNLDYPNEELAWYIKNFIKYAYENWDSEPLQYVLLVGDADKGVAETESYFLSTHDTYEGISSDYWYSCINDDTGNNRIDNSDTTADLSIGRFAVKENSELAVVVNKTVTYEENPPDFPYEDWGSKVFLASGFESHQSSYQRLPFLRDFYLLPNRMEISEIYRHDQPNDNQEIVVEAIIENIDDGRIIFPYTGHGGWEMWENFCSYDNPYCHRGVGDLSNQERLPIVFSMGCLTGGFDWEGTNEEFDDSLGEEFLKKANGGAVAFLGATENSGSGGNNALLKNLISGIFSPDGEFNTENLILGDNVLQAKLAINRSGYRRTYTLQGDPALDISRTLSHSIKPDLLINNITAPLGIFPGEITLFNVTVVNNGDSDAVNISMGVYMNTDDPPIASIGPFDIAANEEITLTDVEIVIPEDWNGQLPAFFVDDEYSIDEYYEGNNLFRLPARFIPDLRIRNITVTSGCIAPGEIVHSDVRVANYGGSGASDVFIGIYIDDTRIDQTGPFFIAALEEITLTDIEFTLPDDWSGALPLFVIDDEENVYESNEDNNTFYLPDTAMPDLLIRDVTVTSQWMFPGETVYLDMVAANDGICDAANVSMGVYMDTDGPPIASIGPFDITANEEITLTDVEVVIPENWNGEIPVLFIDDQEIVYESNENNNSSVVGAKAICDQSGDQIIPAIYEDRVVWEDYRSGPAADIYTYDLSTGTETQITNHDGHRDLSPAIYGERIVWQDFLNGYAIDIYMYDLSTGQETQITSDGHIQSSPAIYGERIVWEDDRNGNWDIYMYDLSTGQETQITSDEHRQFSPAIYGERIVWEDDRNLNRDIYMYDLSTGQETQITTDPSMQWYPAIYGDRIIWQDHRNGWSNIYMYDLSTGQETQITSDGHVQSSPAIYGERIVWEDYRNGNRDIYMYDLFTGQETQITSDTHRQSSPVIYGERIVWEDNRNGNLNIYTYPSFNFAISDFEGNPRRGIGGEMTVNFTNLSRGTDIMHYHWDFGDGETLDTDSHEDVTHEYRLLSGENSRQFTVTLTLTTGEGHQTSKTKENYITLLRHVPVAK